MIITTKKELKRMRRSGRAVREALTAMAAAAKPGVSTLELDQIGAKILAQHESKSAPKRTYKFPGEVCISLNEEALHGIPSKDRILKAGDILKLDLVAELHGWYTDAAITVLVGEPDTWSAVDVRLRECAEWAFHEALSVAKPGVPTNEIGKVIESVAKKYGFGVLKHFGGHGVGKTIHELPFVPNYYMPEVTDVLEEGMVITIEPIICQYDGENHKADDGWTIVTNDGGRAAHYENTLIVTKDEPIIVTD
jgi:methionyl aminopeptidase